jgi:thiamine biosynthesis lipoprotein
MGTQVHLAVLGAHGPGLLIEARRRIEDLENRWSRFRPDSVLCRLNRAEGRAVVVDDETFDLIAAAVDAWHITGHRFDPTVLDALEAAGYDRSFDLLGHAPAGARRAMPAPSTGCAGVRLDPDWGRVQLPPDVRLDLGGIAKGRTADLVATELLAAGAHAAMVNLGGDLRIIGEVPQGGAFSVVVEDPLDLRRVLTVLDLSTGGLTTSSRARRHWSVDGDDRHHLIDPATGSPAHRAAAAVTVVADDATQAEVLATAALVAGPAAGGRLLAAAGVAALVVADDGNRHRVGGIEGLER